jgi:uncharacterized protein YndB with AHSA1/START domain
MLPTVGNLQVASARDGESARPLGRRMAGRPGEEGLVDDERRQRHIDRSVTIRAPVGDLWPAVATADGLETWLGGEVEVDPRPGRPLLVRWPDRSTSRGLVERVETDRRFVFRWRRIAGAGLTLHVGDPTRVEIVLTPLDDGTTRVDVMESPAPMPARPAAVPQPGDRTLGRGAA